MFPINCTTCGKQFSIPDDIYERRVKGRVVTIRCKQCKADIRVDGRLDVQAGQAAGASAEAPPPEAAETDTLESTAPPAEPEPTTEQVTQVEPTQLEPAKPAPLLQPATAARAQAAPVAISEGQEPVPKPALGKPEAKPGREEKAAPTFTPISLSTEIEPAAAAPLPLAAKAGQAEMPARSATARELSRPSFNLGSATQTGAAKAPTPAARSKFESTPRVPSAATSPAAKLESRTQAASTTAPRPKFESRPQLGMPAARAPIDVKPRPAAAVPLPRPALDSRPRLTPPAAQGVAPAPALGAAAPAMAADEAVPSSPPPKPAPGARTSVPPSFPPGSPSEPPLEALWAVDYGEDDRELTAPQIAEDFKSGAIELETLVWHLGMPDWRPIAEVPELAGYLASAAPDIYQGAAEKLATKAAQQTTSEPPSGEAGATLTLPGPPPTPAMPVQAATQVSVTPFPTSLEPDVVAAAQQQKRRVILLIGTALLLIAAVVLLLLALSGEEPAQQSDSSKASPPTPADRSAIAQEPAEPTLEQPPQPATPSDTPTSEQATSAQSAKGKSFAEMFKTAAADAAVGTEKMGPFDQKVAFATLRGANDRVAQCRQRKMPPSKAEVLVTFAPSGRVTDAAVVGGPFKGTPTAKCIVTAVRSVRIAPFSGPAGTVKTSYALR